MDDAGDLLAAGNYLLGYVISFGFENEAVHGVALSCGFLTDVVGRKCDGMALPFRGESLAVGRELAADAIRVGNEEDRTKPVAEVPVSRVLLVEHLLGF